MEGKIVNVLTVAKMPEGVIVKEYYDVAPHTYRLLFWVRLKSGVLLKDISENEIDTIWEIRSGIECRSK